MPTDPNDILYQLRLKRAGLLPTGAGFNPEIVPAIEEANSRLRKEGKPLIGQSRYDEYVRNIEDVADIENYRALQQSGAIQLLNGLGKMGTTAVTTFVSGTLGTLYGIPNAIVNAFDGDDKTTFREGLWNNSVVSAMQTIQDKMENILPNYYTTQERDDAWYKNIFTANFFGDKLLKNAGFTIGAMATMAVPGFKSSFGLGKLVSNIGKAFSATTKGLQRADQAGKIAMRLGNTFIASNGEASIEAYNAAKAFEEDTTEKLRVAFENRISEIEDEMDTNIANGMSQQQAMAISREKRMALEQEKKELQEQIRQHGTSIGNAVWGLNMAVLGVSDNLQFGKLLSGGWKNNKALLNGKNLLLKVQGKETADLKAWGKGLAQGVSTIEGRTKNTFKGTLLGAAKNMLSEGSEEMAQNLASGTEQIKHNALINKSLKKSDSLFSAGIDPDATDELVNFGKALNKAWVDEFGKASSGGWEEFFLGAITGGMGTISVRRKSPTSKNPNGRIGLSWQGGFYEAFKDVQAENAENELKAEYVRNIINKPEFKDNVKHSIAAISISKDMDKALQDNNIQAFKNAELMAVANDALFFKNKGLLDGYKAYYEEIASGLTDTDVENIKMLMTQSVPTVNGNATQSWFDGKTNNEIKKEFKDKASSTLKKIDNIIKSFDKFYTEHYDNILNAVQDPQFAMSLIQEAAATKSLIDDLYKRRTELEVQRASDTTNDPSTYDKEIAKIDKNILVKEKELKEILTNPKAKQEEFINALKKAAKYQAGKESKSTLERYYKANTIQDVADIFYYTDPNHRTQWFKEAVKTAEGGNKELLKQFENFAIQANALEGIVNKYVDPINIPLADKAALKQIIGTSLDTILNDIANDERTKYSKESLSDALRTVRAGIKSDGSAEMGRLLYVLDNVINELDTIDTYSRHQEDIQEKEEKEEKVLQDSEENESLEDSETVLSFDEPEESTEEQIEDTNTTLSFDTPSEETSQNEPQEQTSTVITEEPNTQEEPSQDLTTREQENTIEVNTPLELPKDTSKAPDGTLPTTSLLGMDTKYTKVGAREHKPILVRERPEIAYLNSILGKDVDLDYIVDVILPRLLIKNKNKNSDNKIHLPISFVRLHSNKVNSGKKSSIYIAINKTEINRKDFSDTMLEMLDRATVGDYIICGVFKYPPSVAKDKLNSTSERTIKNIETKQRQWSIIGDDLNKKLKTLSGENKNTHIIVSEYTSEISDIDTGTVMNGVFVNLNDLLKNETTNPNGLNAKNLKLTNNQNVGIKEIGTAEEDTLIIPTDDSFELGTVSVLLENAKGELVPAAKLASDSQYNSDFINKDSDLWKEIESLMHDVIYAKNMNDRLIALSKLTGKGGKFLFSRGDLIHYGTTEEDKKNNLYDKITIKTADGSRSQIDFTDTNLNKEEALETLKAGFEKINPNFAINTKDLQDSTSLQKLLDAGVLRVNIQQLYFVNVSPYITPIDQKTKGLVQNFTPDRSASSIMKPTGIAKKSYNFNGQHYSYDGNNWYNNNDEVIDNSEPVIKNLNAIKSINDNEEGTRVVDPRNQIYASKENWLFQKRHNGQYVIIAEERATEILADEGRRLALEQQKENLNNLNKEIGQIPTIVVDNSTEIPDNTIELDLNTPSIEESSKDITKTVDKNGFVSDDKKSDKNLEVSANSPTFANVLQDNDDLIESLAGLLNIDLESDNVGLNTILAKLQASPNYTDTFKGLIENATKESIEQLIDKIKECGL